MDGAIPSSSGASPAEGPLLPSIELANPSLRSPSERRASRSSHSSMKNQSPRTPSRSSPTSSSGKPRSAAATAAPASESRRKPTFTTCRSYPEYEATAVPSFEPEAELQRSQRRAKVAAVSKIDKVSVPTQVAAGPAATSFLPASVQAKASSQAQTGPSAQRNPLLRPPVHNPPFKIDTVRTEAPRHAPSRSKTRLFGLEECPVFYPTAAEFADPMAYIESIGPQAKPHGICKVVPPEGWNMPFTLDTSTFKFKTRLQRINSLEAASRAKVNFLDQLTMYHLQQGNNKVAIPVIGRVALDLWQLRKETAKLGGFHAVEGVKAWGHIAEMMGFEPSAAREIRAAYLEIILPFETFATRAKTASQSPMTPLIKAHAAAHQKMPAGSSRPSPDTPTQPISQRKTRMGAVNGAAAGAATSSTAPIANGSRSDLAASMSKLPIRELSGAPSTPGPKVKIPGFNDKDGSDSELSSDGTLSPPPPVPGVNGVYQKGEVCELCHGGHAAEKILLCDGCDRGYHTYCLDPPLASVPSNEEWFCTPCLLSQGDDYGFEEGDEHSVASFQARDSAFAYAWWNKRRPAHRRDSNAGNASVEGSSRTSPGGPDPLSRRFGKALVSEDDVEREFWRLTESLNDTVEIEYGADVHSTTHGSAAPTLEKHPLNLYAKDGWNLNNMPILPESLLRYIKSDISGMTVPWIYLGMLFSAFCWHNEDHYTYSINYMFWGETKTWYGIPGDDAAKFEEAIKSEAPELFEQQPGLLYQLVTMMSPGKVRDAGVRVVACDQRPNEFVITFPKAYHCGFNHGINFNEAVNFALPDWLPDGRDSVLHYKRFAKAPVFSHNELLVTITLFSKTIKTAMWLKDGLTEMYEDETRRRDKLRADVPQLAEKLVEEDCPEDQYQCCVCKGFCYLSQVTCACGKAVTCVEHASLLCACPMSSRTLRKRYSEAQLEEIVGAVAARAAIPENWRARLDNVLEVMRPPLKSMRALLSDGEKISFPLPELGDLRAIVDRANAWVERASMLLTRKTGGRRRKGKLDDEDVEMDGPDRSASALLGLLAEAEKLAFDAPEILQLQQMLGAIENFRTEAQLILKANESELDLDQCNTVLILGRSLNFDVPEIAQIETIVNRLKWFRKVEDEVDDRAIQYHEVQALIEEAEQYGVPPDHPTFMELRDRESSGRDWKSRVEGLEAADSVELAQLDALIEGQELTPTDIDIMRNLENVRKTALNWKASAQALLSGNGGIVGANRLAKAVGGAKGLLSKISMPEVIKLQNELDFHAKWSAQLAAVLATPVTKIGSRLDEIRQAVVDQLQPEDDSPTDAHTCYCRDPAQEPMVACETCKGTYHPRCVGIALKAASEPFKCHVCRVQYDTDRPSLRTLSILADTHTWTFVMQPAHLVALTETVETAIRYMAVALPLADPNGAAVAVRDVNLLTHHARKLFTLPVLLDAVDTQSNQRIILEEWLYKRIQDALYPVKVKGRPRRPKLVLAESKEGAFACICKSPPLDQLLTVTCMRCAQGYHMSCVRAPLEAGNPAGKAWRCPCCSVNEGKAYSKNVGVRVQLPEHRGTPRCVDYRTIVNGYRSDLLFFSDIGLRPHVNLTCTGLIPPVIPDDFEPPTLDRDGREGNADGEEHQKKRRKTKTAALLSRIGTEQPAVNGHGAAPAVISPTPPPLIPAFPGGLGAPKTAHVSQPPPHRTPASQEPTRTQTYSQVVSRTVPMSNTTFPWAPRPYANQSSRPAWQPPSVSTTYTSPLSANGDRSTGLGGRSHESWAAYPKSQNSASAPQMAEPASARH